MLPPLAATMAVPCVAPMGCGLFWLIVSCPVAVVGIGEDHVAGWPVCPLSVRTEFDPVSAKSMGLTGTGKYGSGEPLAERDLGVDHVASACPWTGRSRKP